jgi:hypothetical protein
MAVCLAAIALAASGFYSWLGLAVGTGGLVVLGVGVARGSTGGVTLGAFAVFVGTIFAGIRGAPVLPILVSAATVVLAWDVGRNAISIGTQLGRSAETTRLEVVHVAASSGVAVITVGVGYGLYTVGTGDQPVAAVVFLLLAAVLLVAALEG